jgi:hypothetical protein
MSVLVITIQQFIKMLFYACQYVTQLAFIFNFSAFCCCFGGTRVRIQALDHLRVITCSQSAITLFFR